MLLENVELGRMLEIYVEREGYRYRLTSKVEDVNSKRICVTLITAKGKSFQFRDTDKIHLIYRGTEQMWQWDRVSASIIKLDDAAVHAFEVRDNGHSFNRRNAFRVPLDEEVELGFYELNGGRKRSSEAPAPSETETGIQHAADIVIDGNAFPGLNFMAKPQYVTALLRDASELGIGVCTMVDLNVGDSFFVNMPTAYGNMLVKAQVIRHVELKSAASKYRNYYGCALQQADRHYIRYIYEVQRKQIRKMKDRKEEEREKRSLFRRKKKADKKKKPEDK